MGSIVISLIYVTLFLVLSVALYMVIIPSKKEYSDYRKSRYMMSAAFMMVAVIGILRILFPPTEKHEYLDTFALILVSAIFNCLNFISLLYMLETSSRKRRTVYKFSVAVVAGIIVIGAAGIFLPERIMSLCKAVNSFVYIFSGIYLFTASIREYDKFQLQMDNYYNEELNIRWIPGMLWATFILALLMSVTFYHGHILLYTGISSLIVYLIISLKLLNFIPDNIHVVRKNINEHNIIAEDHQEHNEFIETLAETILGETHEVKEEIKTEEVRPAEVKENRRYEKVAELIDRWVKSEHYIRPDINIKDVATEMGTNTNYLSTYLNKCLETSFAVWLNTLRVEKSKEYLCGDKKISVEECGIKVGYLNLYNYSRWFKAVTGVSPSYWRKNRCEISE